MKSIKLLVSGAFVMVLMAPVFIVSAVSAQSRDSNPLRCVVYYYNQDGYQWDWVSGECDLSVKKFVSVNGGSPVDADTVGDAVDANIGDSVTWNVVVDGTVPEAPEGGGSYHVGIVRITDLLPAGVTYVSDAPDYGTFNSSTGNWEFEMNSEEPSFPIELTINTTANSGGQHENRASLNGYDINVCGEEGPGPCGFEPYFDYNSENNADSAWIAVAGPPVVLGDSTPVVLADTGSEVAASLVAGGLIVSTLGLLGYNRYSRKNS